MECLENSHVLKELSVEKKNNMREEGMERREGGGTTRARQRQRSREIERDRNRDRERQRETGLLVHEQRKGWCRDNPFLSALDRTTSTKPSRRDILQT